MSHRYTNALIRETSPYLLQHAHNPVDWKPWTPEVLEQAKKEGKLLVVSIGYAACHWCHVMERESFEDPGVAAVMNKDFINIKVDREERPDVDQVYMNAVQLMTGQGGWPLNIVALPDGRPVWGGTYFPRERWIASLQQIQKLYAQDSERLLEYAANMEKGLQSLETVIPNTGKPSFLPSRLRDAVNRWQSGFDMDYGGTARAPKFMMPCNYLFLLRYARQNADNRLMEYVNLTLTCMAYGGIYDHIGGGFARYSVDDRWHVPHFEKMLYDNGQLVSLYAHAYAATGNKLYRDVVYETLDFVQRELTGSEGAFYSSLDADSENDKGQPEEGAFYVWKQPELQRLLGDDFDLFADYYNINDYGLWEEENYVLIREETDKEIASRHGITPEKLSEKRLSWRKLLLEERGQRPRPRLDDKVLTSWNALMLKGYTDAYKVFGEPSFLDAALKNARFITERQLRPDGGLNRNYKSGKSNINAYLEDYAMVIDAFLALHEVTLDKHWLITARKLADYTFEHFHDDSSGMFFFTSDMDDALLARSMERSDNVIPASNSVMAKNLFVLSRHFQNKRYEETAKQMLHNMGNHPDEHPSFYANWLDLMLNYTHNHYEVVISGKEALKKARELNRYYLPNKLITGDTGNSSLPLLKNRFVENKTLIYVCVDFSCKLPVEKVSDALPQLVDNR